MQTFEKFYKELLIFKRANGHCKVSCRHITKSNYRLGVAVCKVRKGEYKLTPMQKVRLDKIGFVWNGKNKYTFEEIYQLLLQYHKENGHCKVPRRTYIGNIPLGNLVHSIKHGFRKLTPEQLKLLEDLDFVWPVSKNIPFDTLYKLLCEYKDEYGDCLVPEKHVAKGVNLGQLVANIRVGARRLTKEEREKLDELGFVWKVKQRRIKFHEVVKMLEDYKFEYGHCNVPIDYIVVTKEDGKIYFGRILHNIRKGARKTTDEERKILTEMGFEWNKKGEK